MKRIFYALFMFAGIAGTQRSAAQTINTIAGNGTIGFTGDGGAATSAELYSPVGMVLDSSGNLYFSDQYNYRIRKISPSGIISTIAGTGVSGYTGDGGPAISAKMGPEGLAVDRNQNIYVADEYHECVRKIDASGIITTIAGTGFSGYSGDGGAATSAQLNQPTGLAVDSIGNIYITDRDNFCVRKVDYSTGIITTIAGNGTSGYTGDGGAATAAEMGYPYGVATDNSGNIYICDESNNCIRKVNASGIISTYAGTGSAGFSGDGGAATSAHLNGPKYIALDIAGNLYIADESNQRIRKINTSGIITTIAGNGTAGFSGDGGPATAATMHFPIGIEVGHTGKVYFSDAGNERIRVIGDSELAPVFVHGDTQSVTVCENTAKILNTQLAVIDTNIGQTETWSVKTNPVHGTLTATFTATSTGGTLTPTGLSYVPTTGYTGLDSFTVQVNDGTDTGYTKVHVTINATVTAGIITGTDSVCTGSTITLADTVSGGVWSSSNDTVAEIFAGGLVAGIAPGTDTIFYTVSGSCGADTVGRLITVNAAPSAAVITGDTAICAGSMITLAATSAGGTWSTTDAGIAINSTTGVVSGITSGTDTVYYTVSNSCGTSAAMLTVTVIPVPNAGVVTGPHAVCVGDSIIVADTALSGVWSVTNGFASVNSSDGIVTGIAPGLDTVYYEVSNSCGADTAATVVKVSPLIADSIIGRSWVCIGDTTLLITTAGISGIWTSANSHIAVSPGGVLTGIMPGVDTITFTASGSCVIDTPSIQVTAFTTSQCDSALAIGQVIPENSITVYPNPFSNYLIIKGNNSGDIITVTDITGKVVIRHTSNGNNTEYIPTSMLAPSMYFVHIIAANGAQTDTLKLIKE